MSSSTFTGLSAEGCPKRSTVATAGPAGVVRRVADTGAVFRGNGTASASSAASAAVITAATGTRARRRDSTLPSATPRMAAASAPNAAAQIPLSITGCQGIRPQRYE